MLQDSATRDMRYTWFEVLESNPLRDTKFSKTAGRGSHKHGYAQGESCSIPSKYMRVGREKTLSVYISDIVFTVQLYIHSNIS